MDVLTVIVAWLALGLAGAVTGVFFAYSNSVLPGLDAVRPDQAVAAMTSMNRVILNPLFLTTFAGTPIVAAAAGVLLLVVGATGSALLLFAAVVVYVLGVVVPTAVVNVPLNNSLDAAADTARDGDAARVWTDFSARWIRSNSLRAVAGVAALLLIGAGLTVWDYAG